VDAGNTGSNQQLREAALARGRTQWHAIQQDLCSRSAQQKSASAAVIQRAAQLLPRCFELRRRAHVPELIQARELQQNVQAADKRPRPTA
jgi:hypothetical protein